MRVRRRSTQAKVCDHCRAEYFPEVRKALTSRSCSFDCRQTANSAKMRAANTDQVGDRNGNWKGGVSADNTRYARRSIAAHPERWAARRATRQAIESGRLVPRPCEVCRGVFVQAHHDDYDKPLDVRWLCRVDHSMVHGGRSVGVHTWEATAVTQPIQPEQFPTFA